MDLDNKKPISQEKLASISIALAASRSKLNGRSPRTVGVERAEDALEWTYRWGWTTPTMLELLTNSAGRSGLGNRLVKSGLLIKTKTPSGGINDTPSCILTLSQTGLEKVTALLENLHPYELDPLKIKFSTVNHSVTIQRLTATRMNTSINDAKILEFETEKELAANKNTGEKVPDAVWYLEFTNGEERAIAVEVELTGKWEHEFDTFVYRSLTSIYGKKDVPAKYDALEIYSTSQAILNRYSSAFEPGKEVQIWEKEPGKTGRWIRKGKAKIPNRTFPTEIQFIKIDDFLLGKKPVIPPPEFHRVPPIFDDTLE